MATFTPDTEHLDDSLGWKSPEDTQGATAAALNVPQPGDFTHPSQVSSGTAHLPCISA